MSRFFLSQDGSRLRSGWRLLVHTIGYNLISLLILIPAVVILPIMEINGSTMLISQIISLVSITLTVFLARVHLDRRPLSSLGLSISWKTSLDVIAGFLIAGLLMGVIYCLEFRLGWLRIEHYAWNVHPNVPLLEKIGLAPSFTTGISLLLSLLFWLLIFILVAWNEELLFRGYRLQLMAEALGPFLGVVLSSIWFGSAHLFNPEATWISCLGIFLAGLFLAYGYLRTGQLWLPIGLHLGWNFFEGVIFGFPVSGLVTYKLISHSNTGPELWTGGAFGPEAGLILLPALFIGTALIYGYTRINPMRKEA